MTIGLAHGLNQPLATAQRGHIAARNRTAAEGGGAEITLSLLLLPLLPPWVQHHGR